MASQVLSGTSNVSYTNNTGQNVRIIINYMKSKQIYDTNNNLTNYQINISWAGVTATANYVMAIGRNLAFCGGAMVYAASSIVSLFGQNMINVDSVPGNPGSVAEISNNALPTELMLAPGQTFSATCDAYNIVVIPEAG